LRAAGYVRSLPDHILLDRIIRGRVWIPLLGLLLAGIVAMQVEVLKLNAGIGRSLERSSALQAQNELLRAGVSQLSDEQRIERIAAQMGMLMPAPDQLRFVSTGADRAQRAVGNIHAPDPTAFLAALPTIGAPAAAQGTSVNTTVGLTTGAAATGSTASTDTTAATATTGPTDTTAAINTTAPADTAASAGTTASAGATAPTASSTPQTTPVTPVATTPSANGSGQSAASGGVGATPTGG
jgi:cell division protein FtsL